MPFFLALASLSGEAAQQQGLHEINVSSRQAKDPLIESESLKRTPRPASDAALCKEVRSDNIAAGPGVPSLDEGGRFGHPASFCLMHKIRSVRWLTYNQKPADVEGPRPL